MWLHDLPQVLRSAGLSVIEVPGWQDRGYSGLGGPEMSGVKSIVTHWTGTNPLAPGDYPTLSTILNGNAGTPGPLSQTGLARSGAWLVIAAGLCNHAGVVDSWQHSNPWAIGVEAEYHPDQGEWPEVQQRSYERGCKAMADHYAVPYLEIQGHYEVARPLGRKPDPMTLPGGMPGFRQRISVLGPSEEDWMTGVREPLVTVGGISYSLAQIQHLLAAFIQAVAPGTHMDGEGNPVLGDIFGAPVFTDDPGTPQQKSVRLRDLWAEQRDRVIADVDEVALAAELQRRGVTGLSASEAKAVFKAALREGSGS